MKTCSDGHEEIIFDDRHSGNKCPLCSDISRREQDANELSYEIESLKLKLEEAMKPGDD